ncbi:glycine/betaine ABC transporter [Rhizobium sp. Leaf306]|jgi:glycine betaine/proline transport system permease protein|uniref:ABC transporter permease n=1 Tax=Rhizobium/Agrobacterium group TaxID=227290 RepID=UPI0007146C25|nr:MULTISPECIES: proline/glycine betaine ABC transporter permease [unclassified Rhizobium]RYE66723.1 MAG: proline/glycine betaine ABC transporter permease [Rhizobiaceae bacterium]KQQ35331.1 glycine/betaine ABC transporter [Rhizobium sp. Leaf306]MBD8653011.1 proline/glycine betaine ABC transporter permease [Rhizobium sp. CFBP 13726]MBD8664498.1 proline/glycine betaine ABC transporter permease [Rhizobium sp. CFBP 8752]MBP2459905.1 glycine betaine/proline transport system permease protein [Rhizob
MNFNIGDGIDTAVNYILDNFSPFLDLIASAIGFVTGTIQDALLALPMPVGIAIFVALSLWRVGLGFGLLTGIALWLVDHMGLWSAMMETLSLVIASTLMAMIIGLPLGIAMARKDSVAAIVRPILDLMQTMPAFVYLIPAAMFFGLGAVPGAIATVIFAMPPVVRLTNLGIRQVHHEFIEAGNAFGCTSTQLLFKIQLPNALPSIMAGINQTIMLSLSMVVIASMIGAGGLGNTVLTGIQRLDVGTGFEGGLAVVILAVILDRITQSLGQKSRKPNALWRALFKRNEREDMVTATA